MKATYRYKGINQTMKGIRRQIIDSIPYCADRFSGFADPYQLFDYLKQITVFESDPENNELLQSVQTLFENNWWGRPGAGDCDCFTILAISCLIVNGFTPCFIALTGNNKDVPSHIYAMIEYAGKRLVFDLTEPFIGMERAYNYRQILPIQFFS